MEELRLGVRSWCALSVQFCCRTAKTFVVSLTDFYLSANNTCSLEWSRLSLLPASHPVHTDPIQLTTHPDALRPTTLVLSHNRSISFMKTPGTPGDRWFFLTRALHMRRLLTASGTTAAAATAQILPQSAEKRGASAADSPRSGRTLSWGQVGK